MKEAVATHGNVGQEEIDIGNTIIEYVQEDTIKQQTHQGNPMDQSDQEIQEEQEEDDVWNRINAYAQIVTGMDMERYQDQIKYAHTLDATEKTIMI